MIEARRNDAAANLDNLETRDLRDAEPKKVSFPSPAKYRTDYVVEMESAFPEEQREQARRFWDRVNDRGLRALWNEVRDVATERKVGNRDLGVFSLAEVLYSLSLTETGQRHTELLLPHFEKYGEADLQSIFVRTKPSDDSHEAAIQLRAVKTVEQLNRTLVATPVTALLYWVSSIAEHDGMGSRLSESMLKTAEKLREASIHSSLSYATYNLCGLPLWGGFDSAYRYREIGREAKALELDVLAAQEGFESRAREIKAFGGFSYVAPRRQGFGIIGQSGLLTFSKLPIIEEESFTFSKSGGIEVLVRKGALRTLHQERDGSLVEFWNAHQIAAPESFNRWIISDARAAEIRDQQRRELHGWMESRRRPGIRQILLEDGNIDQFTRDYQESVALFGTDLHRARHPVNERPVGSDPTDERRYLGVTFDPESNARARGKLPNPQRLDYIFRGGSLDDLVGLGSERIFDRVSGRDGRHTSDHYGLKARELRRRG